MLLLFQVTFINGHFLLFDCRYLVNHTYANYQSSRMDDYGDEYRSMNHSERMMHKMEGYVGKRTLCDVTLIAGQKRIPAHRLVLSVASDYFAAMFTNDVREAKMEEVKMKDVDAEALSALVHYAYTGEYLGPFCSLQISL